jgi:integrase
MKRPGLRKRDATLYLLLKETGCRTSEVLSIKPLDILSDEVHLPGRIVPISPILKKSLDLAIIGRGPSDMVFQLSARRLEQTVKTLSGRTPRMLRNAYLKNCAENGDVALAGSAIKQLKEVDIAGMPFSREGAIIRIISETGLKTSQLCALSSGSLRGSILIVRGMKYQITDQLAAQLSLLSGKKYLFEGRSGKAISVRRVQQMMKSYGITASQLRRSYAVKLYYSGKNCNDIKSALGLRHVNRFTHGMVFP